jgi:acyl-CoA dehydrogenase
MTDVPDETFRADLCAWLDAHAPASLYGTASTPFQGHWGGRDSAFESEDHKRWFECCLTLGWTAPGWPKAYGGGGMPIGHVRVWKQELGKRGLPLPLVGFGLTMIGPILLVEGSETQKAEHLPKIASGEIRWCQGYSEPNAGSDLASLACKAVRDGDDYLVNGQKIWTSHADQSDWIFCLVRTDDSGVKQQGITFLLIDMSTPGVTVRPIGLISGASPFCETFFEEVRVPVSHVVGTIDDGWKVAKALLNHERGMVGESVAAGGARLPILFTYTLVDHAREAIGLDDQGRLDDPLIRDALVRSEMEQEAMRQTLTRANDRIKAGDRPGPESSIFKVVGTELNMRRWDLAVRIADLDGLGWEGAPFSDRDVAMTRQWLRSRGNSIEGGTSEIQRNIIARRVLGMPK